MTAELDWRRKWIPNLSASPWHPLEIQGSPYLVKWFFNESSYEIILTDFDSFWYEELSNNSLKERVEKLNPGLAVTRIQILEHIQGILEQTVRDAELNISFDPVKEGIRHVKVIMTITSHFAGMPFFWKFFCKEEDSKMCSNHMIIPLMVMVSELKRRQKKLVKIIKKKDREIGDYTSQGLITVKRNHKTEPFVETAFEMSMMKSRDFVNELKNCRTNTFNASGQDLYRQVMALHAWVERSPEDSDEENDPALNSSLEGTRSPNALASVGSSQSPTSITGSKLSKKCSFKSPKKGSSKTTKSPVLKSAEDSELLQSESKLQNEEKKKKSPRI